jgi:hydroxymethylpyrimidine/phosphomethylpyrimidine kinase
VSSPHVVLSIAGTDSGGAAGLAADCEVLLPRCAVVTPNLDEAARLTGLDPDRPAVEIARALHEIAPAVVLTGGDPGARTCYDVVVDRSGDVEMFEHSAVHTSNDHGTGCTFSAALAVHLGRGLDLPSAVRLTQAFVEAALTVSASWDLGRGRGPVAHVFTHHP